MARALFGSPASITQAVLQPLAQPPDSFLSDVRRFWHPIHPVAIVRTAADDISVDRDGAGQSPGRYVSNGSRRPPGISARRSAGNCPKRIPTAMWPQSIPADATGERRRGGTIKGGRKRYDAD